MSTFKAVLFFVSGIAIGLVAPQGSAEAAEYFVTKSGADTNTGTSRDAAFATVQKGVDSLKPGDVLTIAPGEYLEAVRRDDLGDAEHDTTIRAELPGTVTLRGDRAVSGFRKVPSLRYVYVADFPHADPIPAVNEIDTLAILRRMPNREELEFQPGMFFHDPQEGKLYLSTSDFASVDLHQYSVSVIPKNGLHLVRPRRVTVEGLAFTGFSALELVHYREETAGGIWGMFVVHGSRCTVRDCKAYLNGWGIGFNSSLKGSGDNVVEKCESWGNRSPFANGDMGGITIFNARRDTVRDSTSYRNGMYGINIYGTGGAPPGGNDGGNAPEHRSLLERNLAWGNDTADFKIKTGYEYHHLIRNCVGPGLWSATNIENCTIGRIAGKETPPKNSIILEQETNLDLNAEFADPLRHDYRLQSTSRFRATDKSGNDRGAFKYEANVFYVSPKGNDSADGLSVATAWKTVPRAMSDLKSGDTVYVEPGKNIEDLGIQIVGSGSAPAVIRQRGRDKSQPKTLRLISTPAVHSVGATTANIEWLTSLPATCQIAWGDTPECDQTLAYEVNCFGTYSLTGLKPKTTYYFRIKSLETPEGLRKTTEYQKEEAEGESLTFTTLAEDPDARTLYVATDGDDAKDGTSRKSAWRTIRHAAEQVRPGDTVLIAGGRYSERVRIRVTGEKDRPITFRAAPGERVELNGDRMTLNSCFVSGGKSHLRFDGFYFADFNLFPNDQWTLLNCGEFQLHHGRDIQITRCFSEGRGGYSAWPVAAYYVEDLTIKNCVNLYKFGGMYFWRCPNLVIENNVFLQPMIMAFVLRNTRDQRATMRHCIFTDMLDKKARINLGILCCDGEIAGYRNEQCGFFLRDVVPIESRIINGGQTLAQSTEHVIDPLLGDPRFAGDPNPKAPSGYSFDRMADRTVTLDFDSFFATNPEFTSRGIGLEPAAFHDFRFQPASR